MISSKSTARIYPRILLLQLQAAVDNPSDFRFYHLPAELLANAKEMAALFRNPEENKEMLGEYRLEPEQYATKQAEELKQAPATDESAPQQFTKWSMEQVDWQQLARMGITPESLGEIGTARLLNGHESAVLNLKTNFEGIKFETPACIRLVESPDGKPVLNIECCKQRPELDYYLGNEIPDRLKENLLKTHNAGSTIDLTIAGGKEEMCLLSLNSKTNRLHHIPVSEIKIPKEINGVDLTENQRLDLSFGRSVLIEGMWSERHQKHYDARLQYNVCKGGFDYDFRGLNRKVEQGQTERQEIIIPKKLKGVDLTDEQVNALKAGKAAYVQGHVRRERGHVQCLCATQLREDEVRLLPLESRQEQEALAGTDQRTTETIRTDGFPEPPCPQVGEKGHRRITLITYL